MRILFCSEQPPLKPLDDGIRLVLAAVLDELRSRHEVRVVSLFEPDKGERDQRDGELRLVSRPPSGFLRDAALTVRAEFTGRPLRADPLAKQIRPVLREEVSSFAPDVVHVMTGQLAGVRDVLGCLPTVLVAQDAWHRNVAALARGATGVRRFVYQREVDRVRRFEAREYARFDVVVVVTEEDAAALHALRPELRLQVIPNGVDAERFRPDATTPRVPLSIVFHGNLYYAPNMIAARVLAEEILPLVRARIPSASLTILGRRPLPAVTALDNPSAGVRVVADADDLRPWLRAASAYAAPMMTGTGIKNKVLEAMACALPCVVTPLGLQGLQATADRDLLVADDAVGFADQLIHLLEDPIYAQEIGLHARRYVEEAHDWKAVARRYETLYQSLTQASY